MNKRDWKNKGVRPLKFALFSIHHSPFSASMLVDFSAFGEEQGCLDPERMTIL